MIVSLNGHSLQEARLGFAKFLERSHQPEDRPRRHVRSPRVAKLERERTRILKRGTKRMRQAILDALGTMQSVVFERGQIREAGISDIVARLTAALEFMTPQQFLAAIAEIQQEIFVAGINSASSEVNFTWDQPPQQALDALYAATLVFARQVVDREKVAIKNALLEGIDAGDSVPDLIARIKDTLDEGMHIIGPTGKVARVLPEDSWAEQVARSETTRAMSAGVFATYRAAGVQTVQWLSAEDERTCVDCDEADGETTTLGEAFDFVDCPAPPAHPACRCNMISVQADDAVAA